LEQIVHIKIEVFSMDSTIVVVFLAFLYFALIVEALRAL
jgi:hypothetical protein